MKNRILGGAMALPILLCAGSALAQETSNTTNAGSNVIVAIGQRPDDHGPAGMMGDHVHDKGVLMLGAVWQHSEFGGASQTGTTPLSDAQLAADGYMMRTQSMSMDMAMLHIMYAPNDTVTFTLMPMWMRMHMTMVGVGSTMGSGMAGMGAGSGMMPVQTMSHSTEGFGDTEVGATVALSRNPTLTVLTAFNVSIPTGKVDRLNPDGTFVHYGMQSGSGTWDLAPSVTLKGIRQDWSWGLQASARIRAEDANASGFRFGNRLAVDAWVAKPVSRSVSLSARLGYSDEGPVVGQYNGPHRMMSPPDMPANYGGKTIDAGLGANFAFGANWRMGGEVNLPVYQDLNGVQAPRKFGFNINTSRTF